MRRSRYYLIFGLAVLVTTSAQADQLMLQGRVVDAEQRPLANIRIEAEAGSRRTTLVEYTPDDGQFAIDLSSTFPAADLRVGIYIYFTGSGYQQYTRLIRSSAKTRILEIQLDAAGAQPKALVNANVAYLRSPSERTLYLLPYEILGSVDSDINKRLVAQLRRGINTHLQRLGMVDVEVLLVPVQTDTSTQPARSWGAALNALAIVDGQLETPQAGNGGGLVNISSRFTIMPSIAGFSPFPVWVDDAVPSNELSSTQLFKLLNGLWGRNTTLAVGILETKRALSAGDHQALAKVRSYLVAEKADAGSVDDPVLRQIDGLKALIDKEIGP
jgi:hypothetical protein